jgi:hypothetical protein
VRRPWCSRRAPGVVAAVLPSFLADGTVAAAWVLTAAFVALHLGHIRYGLRDQAPPHGRWTFAAMAAVMVAGNLVVGPLWTPLFASLAASALLVFRPPWSVAWVVAIILSCLLSAAARRGRAARTSPWWSRSAV